MKQALTSAHHQHCVTMDEPAGVGRERCHCGSDMQAHQSLYSTKIPIQIHKKHQESSFISLLNVVDCKMDRDLLYKILPWFGLPKSWEVKIKAKSADDSSPAAHFSV